MRKQRDGKQGGPDCSGARDLEGYTHPSLHASNAHIFFGKLYITVMHGYQVRRRPSGFAEIPGVSNHPRMLIFPPKIFFYYGSTSKCDLICDQICDISSI